MAIPLHRLFLCCLLVEVSTNSEVEQFWAEARRASTFHTLDSDESLPVIASDIRRVAICNVGGARSFPLKEYEIYKSVKELLIDRLQANVTDMFYVMDMEDKKGGKGGPFSYTVADFEEAFRVLPPKAAVLRQQSFHRCHWTCYAQYLKYTECLSMLKKVEEQEGFRYDFVVKIRPDMAITQPLKTNVWRLKRAVYTELVPHGVGDMLLMTHRDFAEGMLGMVDFTDKMLVCGPNGEYYIYNEATDVALSMCKWMSCECWMKMSMFLHNATFVNEMLFFGGPIRLPGHQ
jgi:hypothetical protein